VLRDDERLLLLIDGLTIPGTNDGNRVIAISNEPCDELECYISRLARRGITQCFVYSRKGERPQEHWNSLVRHSDAARSAT
jgi:hypothetical protein